MRRFFFVVFCLLGGIAQAQTWNGPLGPTPGVSTGLLLARTYNVGFSATSDTPRFNASSTPTVCTTGDSTMAAYTPGPGGPVIARPGVTPIDYLYYMLVQRIEEDNPTKTITFDNFAIGGQTWTSQNGVATANWPSFYFNHALPWLPFIQAANCTTLYINFGVNDANGFTASQVQGVLAKIAAWGSAPASWSTGAKTFGTVIEDSNNKLEIVSVAGTSGATQPTWATSVGGTTTDGTVTWQLLSAAPYVPAVPDIVLITNKNTNPNAGAPYNTQLNQWGTLNAASYERSIALTDANAFGISGLPQIGLIDIGRTFTEMYNGFDPVEQYDTITITSPTTASSFPYSLPSTAGDMDIQFVVPSSTFNATNQYITLLTGTPGSSAGSTINFNYQNTTTKFCIYNATGQAPTCEVFPNTWNVGQNNTVEVVVRQEYLYVVVNNQLMYNGLVCRFAGPFVPTITLTNPVASPSLTINYYINGTNRPYSPTLTAGQTFGASGGIWGGNGINHDSSIGENAIDWAVLSSIKFAP